MQVLLSIAEQPIDECVARLLVSHDFSFGVTTMATSHSGKTDRRLHRALEYVSDYWLPINHEVARRIQASLASGVYETDRALLKQDIATDLGLFFGCIRELRGLIGGRNAEVMINPDLTSLFDEVDLATIRSALEAVLLAPSVHMMSEGDDAELSRLFEAVLSMTAAHTLASCYDQTPGAAASAAALRQLGFVLIAWNYPSVYRDALEQVKSQPEVQLELLLTRSLGYSPLLLASGLAAKWGFPQELIASSIAVSGGEEEGALLCAVGGTLGTICRVSEQLARAQFEGLYPSAKKDWESATKEVSRVLGPQGIRRIQERCAVTCASLIATSPDVLRPGLLLDEQLLGKGGSGSRNPFIECSREGVKDGFTQLYEIIDTPRSSSKALQFLVRELLPAAKFTGGCVFTVDPTTCQLVPQLDVGACSSRTIEPVHYMVDGSQEDPVLLAFLTAEGCKPIVMENNRDGVGSICAAFGRGQRLGVLYLELPLEELQNDPQHVMAHFQGALRALVDCLRL